MSKHFPDVIEAPEWLKERMRKVQALPPPTLEEVKTAWEASANWEFDCVKEIRKAKYIR